MNLKPFKWEVITKGDGGLLEFSKKMNDLLDEIEKNDSVDKLIILHRTIEMIMEDPIIKSYIKQYYERL